MCAVSGGAQLYDPGTWAAEERTQRAQGQLQRHVRPAQNSKKKKKETFQRKMGSS